MAYQIAFFSDTHLGYAARCRVNKFGVNERVWDGVVGLHKTVTNILDRDVDLVVHGGDLFHKSKPEIADIAVARKELNRFAATNIPVLGITGNHDFANERGKQSATVAVDDPGRNIMMVDEPYRVHRFADGVNVHALSHTGLLAKERIVPELVDGEVNVFVSHGAAQVPGHEIFTCVDSPGEAVVTLDALSMPWDVTLLGHYHAQGPLPGFDEGTSGQAWYAGSLLRRGFSDPPGGRGWLLVTINDNGNITVEPQYVEQRPQHDLEVIDATGLTGPEVEEKVRENVTQIDLAGAIVRQRVINCPVSVRRGVDVKALTELTKDALVWQLEFVRPIAPDFAELSEKDAAVASLSTAGAADLPTMWGGWFDDYAKTVGVAETLQPVIAEQGTKLLNQVSDEVNPVDGKAGDPA